MQLRKAGDHWIIFRLVTRPAAKGISGSRLGTGRTFQRQEFWTQGGSWVVRLDLALPFDTEAEAKAYVAEHAEEREGAPSPG